MSGPVNPLEVKRVRLTRDETAERLGLTLSGLQYVESKLTRYRDRLGFIFYYQDEVDAYKATRASLRRGRPPNSGKKPRPPRTLPRYSEESDPLGELGRMSALIFEAFQAGESHRSIVIRLKVAPSFVKDLFDNYWNQTPKLSAEEKEVRQLNRRDDAIEHSVTVARIRAQADIESARIIANGATPPKLRAYEKPVKKP